MTKKQCPLGEDCDLTIAWMAGAAEARDRAKARIAALEDQLRGSAAECERVGRLWHDAEAKLAKAVEVLDRLFDRVTDIRGIDMYAYCPDELHNASAVLDELKGDKP